MISLFQGNHPTKDILSPIFETQCLLMPVYAYKASKVSKSKQAKAGKQITNRIRNLPNKSYKSLISGYKRGYNYILFNLGGIYQFSA